MDCSCVDDVLREKVVYTCECKDGSVKLFCLGTVAEFLELFVVSSLSKSCVVSVRVGVAWEERVEVGVCFVESDFVQ